MIVLNKNQIVKLHEHLITETGGSQGVRDEGLLDSAVNAPFQRFDNIELFPTVQQKAARLGYGIIKNHPFTDGNKRTGTHSMLIMLELNGIEMSYTQEELYSIILKIAGGKSELKELTDWILNHQI